MNLFTRGALLALAAACLPACNSMTATSIESLNLAISGKANVISVDYIRSVKADSLYIQAGATEGLFVAPAHSGERVNWYGLTDRRGPVEKIDILGSVQPHQRIDETIWMPQLDYKAINYYWLDMQTGQVRRSIQHISPTLPVMAITLTRLPSMGETP